MDEDRLRVIFGNSKKTQPICNFTSSPAFEYTVDSPRLTFEQRRFYEDNGFLVMRNLLPHQMLDSFRQRFLDIVDGKVKKGLLTVMKDVSLLKDNKVPGDLAVNKIQDFNFDPVLNQYLESPLMLDVVEAFTGPNIMAMHTMLINKPPDTGSKSSRHPMHQDQHYFPFRPSNRIVCAWAAMERVNEDNGCLFVIPGTHKGLLKHHGYPDWQKGVNSMFHGVKGYDEVPKVLLPMEKGDVVFFHPILLHGSGTNSTNCTRKAISCHFSSSDCHYVDVKGSTQEILEREGQEIFKRRGWDLKSLSDWFQLKCSLVRGRPGTMA